MVLPTFEHLPEAKQARVTAALLAEFSHYPLAQAQVARIVTAADIARGAFYKYFQDLTDAYQYVFQQAMREIHSQLPQRPTTHNTAVYIDAIRQFVGAADACGYQALIVMHYRYNEGFLGVQPSRIAPPKTWAFTTLYHQTLRDVLLAPDTLDARLAQLEAALAE
jgi:AcrR family transcriptional regulator